MFCVPFLLCTVEDLVSCNRYPLSIFFQNNPKSVGLHDVLKALQADVFLSSRSDILNCIGG